MTNKEKYIVFCKIENDISVIFNGWWSGAICREKIFNVCLAKKIDKIATLYDIFDYIIELEKATGLKTGCGRQHYLRFAIPNTWQVWEDNGMEWDSTLSYADKEGFRCGVCYEYSVFNILSRKKLKLKEKPLIVMEGSFVTYQPDVEVKEMEVKIAKLIQTVKKYNGEFVFLWHNSCFPNQSYSNIYEKIVNGVLG